jgi:hypothetical protein
MLIMNTYAPGTPTSATIGGYTMTGFDVTNSIGGSASSVASPISGALNFVDINNDSLALTRRLADDVSWWNKADIFIFTDKQKATQSSDFFCAPNKSDRALKHLLRIHVNCY